MKCIYCDEDYFGGSDLFHSYMTRDPLCKRCRDKLILDPVIIKVEEMEVRSYYLYEENLRDLLIQYKECYDEALKDVFFYPFKYDILFRYYDRVIITVPSSRTKLKERGFDHMRSMVDHIALKKLDALEKIEDISQTHKSESQRKEMLGNIKVKDGVFLPHKILLVDDVLTSGSSLLGAYRVLCDRDVKVLSLSHNSAHSLKKRVKVVL